MEGDISKDVYLEIARAADNRTILKMLSVNKRFNTPAFFQEIINRKYPSLFKRKKNCEDWKHFYLRIVKYTAKLQEEFDHSLPLDEDPEIFYKKKFCKRLLNKIGRWGKMDVDVFTLYETPNIYELLYNSEENGNHDATGSYLINETTHYPGVRNTEEQEAKYLEYVEELQKLSPIGIFGEESALNELIADVGDLVAVDALMDREPLVYDYKLLDEILERNGKTFEEYEQESSISREMIMNYPRLYAAKLAENPAMNDMEFLHDNIRWRTNELVEFLIEGTELDVTAEELLLTDEEIEFLLSLHRRILDPNDTLTIVSLVKCKNLVK